MVVECELMTHEQRTEVADLVERREHSDTMTFTALDAAYLAEYEALGKRLVVEHEKESQSC